MDRVGVAAQSGAAEKLTQRASSLPPSEGLVPASRSDTAFKFRCGQHAGEATSEAQGNKQATDAC